jgi:hypothetical protein
VTDVVSPFGSKQERNRIVVGCVGVHLIDESNQLGREMEAFELLTLSVGRRSTNSSSWGNFICQRGFVRLSRGDESEVCDVAILSTSLTHLPDLP